MKTIILGAALSLLLVRAGDVAAQSSCQLDRIATSAAEAAELALRDTTCAEAALPNPDGGTAVSARARSLTPSAYVVAEKGDSEVQIQLGRRLGISPALGQMSLNATLIGPLSDDPLSPLAELRGALPGTALELGVTGLRWPRVRQGTTANMLAWCGRHGIPMLSCTQAEVETNHRELLDSWLQVSGYRRPRLYHASIKAAYDERDFVDETTLEAGSRNVVPLTASATYGWFLGQTLMTINGRWERRFEDGQEVQICEPVGDGGAEACETARMGEPESTSNTVITGQARRFLFPGMAVNVRGVYRVDDEAWSVEAPLYFIPGGKGELIGGIVPGWSSEDDRFTIRLFVGSAFGLKL